MFAAIASMAAEMKFTYVHIPADSSRQMVEMQGSARAGSDPLVELLRPHFQGGHITDVSHLRAEFGDKVDERFEQLEAACNEGTVEVFALVRPAKSTRPVPHAGTFLYFDEMGALKGLQANERAASIARECGLDVESPFLGDCFIGRVQVEPPPLHVESFTLAELQPGSPFLSCAASENAMYDMALKKHEAAMVAARKNPEAESRSAAEHRAVELGYVWEQSTDDVEVTLKLPDRCTKAKDISVDISSTAVRVTAKGTGETLLELSLWGRIHPDESTWTVNSSELQLSLEKIAGQSSWGMLEAA